MDSKYLAVHIRDNSIIVPMFSLTGSELSDYRLENCTCQQAKKAVEWKKEVQEQLAI
jgi:hypothetical protein